MTFKGTSRRLPDIARDLGVRYVLEGSVRKAGNDLRITAQLIEAASDVHLWSEKFTGTLEDIFDIQEKVSRSIVKALEVKFTPEAERAVGRRPISVARAYEYYLRAGQETLQCRKDSLDRALQYPRLALALEGPNALLYSQMGMTYCNHYNVSDEVREEYLDEAELCAARVAELAPGSSHEHGLRGFIAYFRGRGSESLAHLEKAREAGLRDDLVTVLLALAYFYRGDAESMEEVLERLSQTDPLNPLLPTVAALLPYTRGRLDLAMETAARGYRENPDVPQGELYYAYYLGVSGGLREALTILERHTERHAGTVFESIGSLLKCALQGDREGGALCLSPRARLKLRTDLEWTWLVADGLALLGDTEPALEWLEHAVSMGFVNHPLLSEHDPYLARLRDDERFQKLMGRVRDEGLRHRS